MKFALLGLGLATFGQSLTYCDQWTPCQTDQQCSYNRTCVPLFCQRPDSCSEGYECYQGRCISTTYAGRSSGYCDKWTKCQSPADQCVNKQCIPLNCFRTPDCLIGYQCYDGKCIQISNSHGVGRYCDENNECDVLHVCSNKFCVWK